MAPRRRSTALLAALGLPLQARAYRTPKGEAPRATEQSGSEYLMDQVHDRSLTREEREEAAMALCMGSRMQSAGDYARAMAASCVRAKLWRAAVAALHEMRGRSLEPTAAAHVAMVEACGKSGWSAALRQLADLRRRGVEAAAGVRRAAAGVLSHAGRWERLTAALAEMEHAGAAPGLGEYSAAVRACQGPAKGGMAQGALLAALDARISRSQLFECEAEGLWEQALGVLGDMARRRQDVDSAAFGAVLRSCGDAGQWPLALVLLQEWREKGLGLDAAAYGLVLGACAERELWEPSVLLIQEMRGLGLPPGAGAYGRAISACARGGQWQWVLGLLQEMKASGLEIDSSTYDVAISACGEHGQWKWALALLEEMQEAGFHPSASAYHAAIVACEKGGQQAWVDQLKSEMQQQGLVNPEVSMCRAASRVAGEGDRWRWALGLLGGLRSAGRRPDAVAYRDGVDACAEAGQWERALGLLAEARLAGLELGGGICDGAIRACGRSGHWEWALALLVEAEERGLGTGAAAYNAAIRACHDARHSECSLALVDGMQRRGLQPELALYNAVAVGEAVDATAQVFFVGAEPRGVNSLAVPSRGRRGRGGVGTSDSRSAALQEFGFCKP